MQQPLATFRSRIAFALTIAVAVAVAVTGCGGGTEASTPSPPAPPAAGAVVPAKDVQPPAPAAAAPAAAAADDSAVDAAEQQADAARAKLLEPWKGDLDGMVKRRVVRVLVTYSKTHYFVDQGTQRGLTYELGRMFEDDLNKKLKTGNLRVNVVFLPVAHDRLIPDLVAGRGDIAAANLTITPERQKQVDFARPTFSNIDEIVVTGPAGKPVAQAEDLAGREVYLRPSSSFYASVQALNQRLKAAGKPEVKVREAPEVLADEDILEMVNAGLVPATVIDSHIGAFWAQIFPAIVLNKNAKLRTGGDIAPAIRKGSPQLAAALDELGKRYAQGSAERNILLQRYLKQTKYALAATAPAERAKFQRTGELFRRYGDKYSLDYLLMAAQGYQESRLDQGAMSHVGAIGVMQVMPATGKELAVGDISQLEPNIHAGVKYVRGLIDTYYANEPMTPLNKGLFAFASYNAGPGRIRQMRKKAEARGLDPNIWFNNVEVVTSEVVGRETVSYVSNIYKYYLAYKMLVEQSEARAAAKKAAQR